MLKKNYIENYESLIIVMFVYSFVFFFLKNNNYYLKKL